MKRCLFFLLIPSLLSGQKIKPLQIAKLPKTINESSGLVKSDSNLLWAINDGGGGNLLYAIDYKGNLIRTAWVCYEINKDWEDLAIDKKGCIYIGDFGNNFNFRENFNIYKISKAILVSDTIKADSQIVFHRYPDQFQYPPPPGNWNFDCEAFVHYKDSLYLFSKNLSNPNDGFTKLYRLSDRDGMYFEVDLIDSFFLDEPVTSADISPDGNTVVLLTYFSLWVFKDFPDNNFFSGKVFQFPFKGLTQKEAICFVNDHQLFLTDERHHGKGGKLYSIDLNHLDFSQPTKKFKSSWSKKAVYNFYNNPKRKYKRIMQREAVQ